MLKDVIQTYNKTSKEIQKTISGRNKFNLIISFVQECERKFNALPSFALFKDFLFILVEIILKSDINFTDPSKLTAVKHLLHESKKEFRGSKGDDFTLSQIEKAVDIINMQLLKVYFYIGKYEEGLSVLTAMLREKEIYYGTAQVTPEERVKEPAPISKKQNKYSLVNPEIYKESRAYEILNEIKAEFERLNSYSGNNINILLVEHESAVTGYSNGTIQSLHCETEKREQADGQITFENITDYNDTELEDTLKEISSASNNIILKLSGKTVSGKLKRSLYFESIKGVYKGASLGLGAAVASACSYFIHSNKRKIYMINNAAAFTGAIDSSGKAIKVNSAAVKDKVEAAFFSWVKYCVVPKENYNDAEEAYRNLKSVYPTKEMTIIGVETACEVFDYPELIKTEIINTYEYSKSVIERNKMLSYSAASLLLIIVSVYLSIRFIPHELKPLPLPKSDMSIIYAPDREEKWLFKNADYFGGDTIDFGDVVAGDQWLPMIELWNNSYNDESFDFKIEGSDDFEILWYEEEKQPAEVPDNIKPDIVQRFNIKYAPLKPAENVNAKLIISSKLHPEENKTIYLKAASDYYRGGYSAVIKDGDDRILVNPGKNLTQKEFTVSFWIKPEAELLKNTVSETYQVDFGFPVLRYSSDNPSINSLTFSIRKDSTFMLYVLNRKADFKNSFTLITKRKIRFNEWNYVCASYGMETAYLALNEETVSGRLDKDIVRQNNDIIIFGNHHPAFDKNRNYDKLAGSFKIFNFKVYEKYINPEKDEAFRYVTPKWDDEGIVLNYEFAQMNEKKVFDLSKSDIWAAVSGGVVRSLDIPEAFTKKEPFGKGVFGNTVLQREEEGRMEFFRNIFKGVKNFTIQMDVKYSDITETNEEFFTILNPEKEYFLSISKDSVFMHYGKFKITDRVRKSTGYAYSPKWQRYTLTYENGITDVYAGDSFVLKMEFPESSFNIERMNYGIVFGNIAYIASARHYGRNLSFDNIRIFNRAISQDEIYGNSINGLPAEWTFDNIQGYYAYDNVMQYPALLKGKIKPMQRE